MRNSVVVEEIVLCPACLKVDWKSKVYPMGIEVTHMESAAFYDEEGKYHCQDPNVVINRFKCSKGHQWMTKAHGNCNCAWAQELISIEIIKGVS